MVRPVSSSLFYRAILKRNSTFWASSVGIAFFADIALDYILDLAWEANNRGVNLYLLL